MNEIFSFKISDFFLDDSYMYKYLYMYGEKIFGKLFA